MLLQLISTAIAGKANTSTTYTVDNVNNLLSGKQNSLTFIDPENLNPPAAGFPLLIGTNIVPGLSVNLPLTLTRGTNSYLTIGLSTSIFNAMSVVTLTASGAITSNTVTTDAISSSSLTTNTLTTSSASFNIKSNLVRFRGLDNTIYIEAYPGGVQFYDGAFMYSSLQAYRSDH